MRLPSVLPVLAASALTWALLFAAVPASRQDFPLDDDWAFAKGAFDFAAGTGTHYFNWASMPQLGQWLWAYPFIKLFGPNFVTLRLATIVLSLIGLAAFHDLLRRDGQSSVRAALATASLAFNPLFFLLQGTFMTDVPALSFALVALACFRRALGAGIPAPSNARKGEAPPEPAGGTPTTLARSASEGARRGDPRSRFGLVSQRCPGGLVLPLTAGTLAAILAVTTRQGMVAVPLTVAVLLWRSRAPGSGATGGSSARARALDLDGPIPSPIVRRIGFLGVLLPLVILVAVQVWLSRRPDVRPLGPAWPRPETLVLIPYQLAHFLGLSTLPVLAATYRPRSWTRFLSLLAIMLALAGYWYEQPTQLPYGKPHGGMFPYQHNLLTPWGAFAGKENEPLVPGDRPVILGPGVRLALTLLGCVGGAAWLDLLWRRLTSRRRLGPTTVFGLWQLPFIVAAPVFHDRYLLGIVPGALELDDDDAPSPGRTLVGFALVAFMTASSVALMHDWLSWNAARWELGRQAMGSGVRAADIEGGLEWDGYHTAVPKRTPPLAPPGLALASIHRIFPEVSGRYALSFSPLPDSIVTAEQPYSLWLSPGDHAFYLLRHEPGTANGAAPAK